MKSFFPIFVFLGAVALCSCDRTASVSDSEVQYASLAPRVQSRAGTSVSTSDSVLISVVAGTKVIDTTYPYAAHRGVINHVPVGAIYALTVRGFNSVNTSSASSSSTADTAKTRVTVWTGTDTGTAVAAVDSATVVTVDTATPLVLGLKDSTKHLATTGTVTIPVVGTDSAKKVLRYAIDAEPTAVSALVPAGGKIAVTRTCRVLVRTFQKISGVWVGASVAETLTVHIVPASPKLSASVDSAAAAVSGSWSSVDSTAKYLFYVASDSVSASDLATSSHLKNVVTATKATASGLSRGQRYTLGVRTVWGPDSLLRDTGAVAWAVVTLPQDSTVSVSFASPAADTTIAHTAGSLAVRVKAVAALGIDSVVLNGNRLSLDSTHAFWTGSTDLAVGLDTLKAVAYAKGKTGIAARKVTRATAVMTAKPVIERISPTRDSTMLYTGQASYVVQVQVNDSNAVSYVKAAGLVATASNDVYSRSVQLVNGWNTIPIQTLDAVGNTATDTVRVFTDLVLPTLAFVSPDRDSSRDSTEGPFLVEVSTSDNVGVRTVTMNGIQAQPIAGTNHWSAVITTVPVDSVRVVSTDSSGNQAERTLHFYAWYGRMTDRRDNHSYLTVKIGTQVWMAENLNYAGLSNDTGVCYGSSADSCVKYGRLYTWHEAMAGAASSVATPSGVRGICPEGWHVPSNAEWTKLTDTTLSSATAGTQLKSMSGWNTGNGTDAYGFRVLPAGAIGYFGESGGWCDGVVCYRSAFWSSSGSDASDAGYRDFDYGMVSVFSGNTNMSYEISLRCVKDN